MKQKNIRYKLATLFLGSFIILGLPKFSRASNLVSNTNTSSIMAIPGLSVESIIGPEVKDSTPGAVFGSVNDNVIFGSTDTILFDSESEVNLPENVEKNIIVKPLKIFTEFIDDHVPSTFTTQTSENENFQKDKSLIIKPLKIYLFEDNSFSRLEKKIITLVEKLLAPYADVLISVGLNVGKELREAGIGVEQKWVSIAPGVEALALLDKSEARKAIGVNESAMLVGWMARMTSVKNPSLLLEVASRLPDVEFVMAGGGDLFETIKSDAPRNVKVIGWADAATFWSAVDIAMSTSDNEGMPVALIEAQMAGIPVIATNVGSNSEVVQDELTGLIASKSVDELVGAVNRFRSLPDLIRTLGGKGREWTGEEFSLEKMIRSHTVLYRHLNI